MQEYGVFAQVVAICTSLVAAATAIIMAFTRRAKWQPPVEAVPNAVARITALISSVFIAGLYVFSVEIGIVGLAVVAGVLLLVAIVALLSAIRINIAHSYYYPNQQIEENRVLGGNTLTDESLHIKAEHGHSVQQLFTDAQGDKDLVWTRDSRASVNLASTLSFVVLIAAGSCSLAAAGSMVAGFIQHQGG